MDDEANFDTEMQKFAKFFIKNHPDPNRYPRPDPNDKKNHSVWYNFDYRRKKYTPANLLNEKKPSPYLKPKLHKTFLQGYNVWVLKPTGLNRGRGIEIFNTLEALNSYINVFFEGRRAKRVKKEDEYESDEEDESEDDNKLPNYQGMPDFDVFLSVGPVVKSHTFVIQKYIENLLVVNNRKFDIRVWILVTQDMQLYFFKYLYFLSLVKFS
jgi:Tubulin-tyrosine ligase family.